MLVCGCEQFKFLEFPDLVALYTIGGAGGFEERADLNRHIAFIGIVLNYHNN